MAWQDVLLPTEQLDRQCAHTKDKAKYTQEGHAPPTPFAKVSSASNMERVLSSPKAVKRAISTHSAALHSLLALSLIDGNGPKGGQAVGTGSSGYMKSQPHSSPQLSSLIYKPCYYKQKGGGH